ncbi:hypothetical protein GF337_20415 [candidate division KSB1 bacterium]|nr:hypothetical protein [candidate division KSB1 bacterium]
MIMNIISAITLIFLFSFGSEKIENIPLSEPLGISSDVQGNIYIADTGNNRILKFDENGLFLKSIGGFGWENQQFDMPLDVYAKSVLDVFVADYNNHRIERYDKDLNYISTLSSDETKSEDLRFGYPRSVAISIHGELTLIDGENNRVLKIDSFGEPELSFGTFADGRGKLDEPIQIDISRDERIYVSDKAGKRIVVYDYFGNYLSEIGTGVLEEPQGLFIDLNNRLWIADPGRGEIFTFSAEGELMFRTDATEQGNGKLERPVDVAVTANKLYVIDNNIVNVAEIREFHESGE